MKRTLVFLSLILLLLESSAQKPLRFKPDKYPSLFWEITGNGLKKPSYLFGTMHVSSKLAFFLSDSFYIALKSAEVVALENNPETWQEDMEQYGFTGDDFDADYEYGLGVYRTTQVDEGTFRRERYEKRLETALYAEPIILNSLLYRSYGNSMEDFQEDTYLDLYIFQTGKKLGKKVAGVEQYGESLRLVKEASYDAMKEESKTLYREVDDPALSEMNLQEAYRSGNLDWLDTIHRANSQSKAFDEKFIYRRNEIQAHSIDSILKRNRLFVGVGAAHLPGKRGVIDLLRAMGYTLRPIFMPRVDRQQREQLEKIRVPVKFQSYKSPDGLYTVEVPGKLYNYEKDPEIQQSHFADMANGSYYMVTRLKTAHRIWGDGDKDVLRKIDSVLYENIPGKILSKVAMEKNGIKGWEVVNKKRNGDIQRSQIFVTPYEVIVFKMSGRGEYVRQGEESKRFFESIRLAEIKTGPWQNWKPSYGGFQVDLPQEPVMHNNLTQWYETTDKTTGGFFWLGHFTPYNSRTPGDDHFELELIRESFGSGEYIDSLIGYSYTQVNRFPTMDARFRHKNGKEIKARFIIQGQHHYALAALAEPAQSDRFLQSFNLRPFQYGPEKEVTDTTMAITLRTPWFPKPPKKGVELPDDYGREPDDETALEEFREQRSQYRLYRNDSTGERVTVEYSMNARYATETPFFLRDRISMPWINKHADTIRMVRQVKTVTMPDGLKMQYLQIGDTMSSRVLHVQTGYRKGVGFRIMSIGDTLTEWSPFIKAFFTQLRFHDTLQAREPDLRKADLFFADLNSEDTLVRRKALAATEDITLDSMDLCSIQKAIAGMSWKDKEYINHKVKLISRVSSISTPAATDYLRQLYNQVEDTLTLQHAVLETLLGQKNSYAYDRFRQIIKTEPPLINIEPSNDYSAVVPGWGTSYSALAGFMQKLYDSLPLTKTILPDLLPLVNLEDYKPTIQNLLRMFIDSNMVTARDIESYLPKFYLEAQHALRKQKAIEKNKAIQHASREEGGEERNYFDSYSPRLKGNLALTQWSGILIAGYDQDPAIRKLFDQLLGSNDIELRFETARIMINHQKKIPDTLLTAFARDDKYRFPLYSLLEANQQLAAFPAAFRSRDQLAKSILTQLQYDYEQNITDTLSIQGVSEMANNWVGTVWVQNARDTGYVLFFKYKKSKEDPLWKLASVGLFSEDTTQIGIKPSREDYSGGYTMLPPLSDLARQYQDIHVDGYTGLWPEKIEEEKDIPKLIQTRLRKIYYSKHPCSDGFYNENDRYDYVMTNRY